MRVGIYPRHWRGGLLDRDKIHVCSKKSCKEEGESSGELVEVGRIF